MYEDDENSAEEKGKHSGPGSPSDNNSVKDGKASPPSGQELLVTPPGGDGREAHAWKMRGWSECSVTCGNGECTYHFTHITSGLFCIQN